MPISKTTATLPKVIWASPSPIREKRRRTRNTPSKEEIAAINIPANSTGPVSKPSSICMIMTPVSVSPAMMARWTKP